MPLLPRERLAVRARRALEHGDLLLHAGAGYGKTSLLEEALGGERPAAAWVDVTEAECDPGLLLMRVARALAEAAPGATDGLVERLEATPGRVDVDAVGAELTAELGRLLLEPVVLVLDDAERLDGADGALAVVAGLLGGRAPRLHVAIASRHRLALPLARMRAAGRLTEFGAGELGFGRDECAALLRAHGVEPSDEQVWSVLEPTRGWPLGVTLAARQLERREADGAAPPAEPRAGPDLSAYLSDELLPSLPPEVEAAAVRSSAAERVTSAVARELRLPAGLADRLERAGLPIRHTGPDGAFAHHPLVREHLRERLRDALRADERRRLHAGLARAASEDGDRVAAITHWLAAEDWPRAADAVERDGPAFVRTSPALVRAWIDRLPAALRRRPALRGLEGQSWWLAGDNARAIPAFRAAAAGADAPVAWLARALLVDALFAVGEPDGIPAAVDGWEHGPPAFGLPPAAAMLAATALAHFGRFDESERLAQVAERHPDSALLGPLITLRRAAVDVPAGRLDETCALLRDAIGEMERFDPLGHRAHLLGALGTVLWERGDREGSLALWRSIRTETRATAPVLADATHAWCALLHAEAGRLEAAEAELAQHRRLEGGARAFVADLAPAAVASLRGDAATAEAAACAALVRVERGPLLMRYWVGTALVAALGAVGRTARAAEVLHATLGVVDANYPGAAGALLRGRLLALRAWLWYLGGDGDGADAALVEARAAAGPAGGHVLRREWKRLAPVLWEALERDRLEPATVIEELDRAFPAGLELVPLLDHPRPAVRAAVLRPAVASGDPRALAGVGRLAADGDPELARAAAGARAKLARALPPLRLEVLGRFALTRGGWRAADTDWGRPVDARLVRLLLTRLDAPVPEDLIFEALWPDLEPRSARRSLQVAASRARKLLDPPGTAGSAIEAADGCYRLVLGERDRVDADDLRVAAARALAAEGEERLPKLERARALWRGEPLPEERYSDWATAYREGLCDLNVAVLTALVRCHERAGDHAAAAGAARALVEADPLDQGGHRALITAYARAGRTGQALRQYLECRRALVEELGIEPSAEMARLQARVLAGEPV